MTGGVKSSGKDLALQLNRELTLARQHSDNARTLAEQLEHLHMEEEKSTPKVKTPRNRSKSKSPKPGPRKETTSVTHGKSPKNATSTPAKKQPSSIIRVKVSGGPNKQKFEVGTQTQAMKKLTDKFPGRLEWATSKVQVVIIPNDVPKASDTSKGKLAEDGKVMHYDEFVAWMNENK